MITEALKSAFNFRSNAKDLESRSFAYAEDFALANAVLAGDHLARRRFVDRVLPLIFSVTHRFGIHAHNAEDVSQETLLKVFTQLKQYRGESKLSSWVFTVARRCALDYVRHKSRRESATDFSDPLNESLIDKPSHGDAAAEQKDADKMTTLIDAMSEPARTVLLRYYLADETVLEIAQSMKMAEGTIKTLLHRGRQSLRDALELS